MWRCVRRTCKRARLDASVGARRSGGALLRALASCGFSANVTALSVDALDNSDADLATVLEAFPALESCSLRFERILVVAENALLRPSRVRRLSLACAAGDFGHRIGEAAAWCPRIAELSLAGPDLDCVAVLERLACYPGELATLVVLRLCSVSRFGPEDGNRARSVLRAARPGLDVSLCAHASAAPAEAHYWLARDGPCAFAREGPCA